MPKWASRSFKGERDYCKALQAFKMILYNYELLNARQSDYAKVCMRIAWIYRFMKNEEENEKKFLEYALKYYQGAYEGERFPIDQLDEFTCAYIIGELYLRLDNYPEAFNWFSKIISDKRAKDNNPDLVSKVKDRMYDAKEMSVK